MSRSNFATEAADTMEATDVSNRKFEQQGLLEIEDGNTDEPKKRSIRLVNDPVHSYQGRRRCMALMMLAGLLAVLYLSKLAWIDSER
jgi:hypothetical protein